MCFTLNFKFVFVNVCHIIVKRCEVTQRIEIAAESYYRSYEFIGKTFRILHDVTYDR